MKKDIHPAYHTTVKITCSCGATFVAGSTRDEITTELCSSCHPFYSGKQKIIDTAGRIEKFKQRLAQSGEIQKQRAEDARKAKEKPVMPEAAVIDASALVSTEPTPEPKHVVRKSVPAKKAAKPIAKKPSVKKAAPVKHTKHAVKKAPVKKTAPAKKPVAKKAPAKKAATSAKKRGSKASKKK